jgi:D-glycero-D-manno-heptose 1,7-bisphosphate phosphatase
MDKAVFFDRDGVINELVWREGGYCTSPHKLEELVYMPQAQESVKAVRKLGYKTFVVTNQPGIYYGDMDLNDLVRINTAIKYWLHIDEIYAALIPFRIGEMVDEFAPAAPQDYKPASGAIFKLLAKYKIDPHHSFMVGDRWKDIVAGHNADLTTIYCNVCEYECEKEKYKDIKPDFWVKNIGEVPELIKRLENGGF